MCAILRLPLTLQGKFLRLLEEEHAILPIATAKVSIQCNACFEGGIFCRGISHRPGSPKRQCIFSYPRHARGIFPTCHGYRVDLVCRERIQDLKQRLRESSLSELDDSWSARKEGLTVLEDVVAELRHIKTDLEKEGIFLAETADVDKQRYIKIMKVSNSPALKCSCSGLIRCFQPLYSLKNVSACKPLHCCPCFLAWACGGDWAGRGNESF